MRMQTVSEDLDRLKESREKQVEMSDSQQRIDLQLLEEQRINNLADLEQMQKLIDKKLIRKLISQNHQELKKSFLDKLHSGERKQLQKEIEIKKREYIQSIMQAESPACQKEMSEKVANMITSQQAQLDAVHNRELQSYNEISQKILRALDLEILQLEGSTTDSGCSLDSHSSLDILPP